jgi:hypothetical protein
MTSQVLGGAILAIGIAYIKVSPFLPEVTTHTHTHTHTKYWVPFFPYNFQSFGPYNFQSFGECRH